MRTLLKALILGSALTVVGAGGALAAMNKATVTFHPVNMHMMSTMHAMGSATITYSAHDADIKVTTDNLPRPAVLHAKVYVLWLVNGNHKMNAGHLTIHGMMAGLHTMTMDTNFNKLVISAEKSATEKIPMGTNVLVGAVMRH